jgi:hypothetical protein
VYTHEADIKTAGCSGNEACEAMVRWPMLLHMFNTVVPRRRLAYMV